MTFGEQRRKEGRKYALYIANCLRLFNSSFEFNILINSCIFCFRFVTMQSWSTLLVYIGCFDLWTPLNNKKCNTKKLREICWRKLINKLFRLTFETISTKWYFCVDKQVQWVDMWVGFGGRGRKIGWGKRQR